MISVYTWHQLPLYVPYLDVKFVNIIEKILYAILALSAMKEHKLDIPRCQEC